jgi:hypothetical protein
MSGMVDKAQAGLTSTSYPLAVLQALRSPGEERRGDYEAQVMF